MLARNWLDLGRHSDSVIFVSNFSHRDYLVWWVRISFGVIVKIRVDVMVRVSKLLGSD